MKKILISALVLALIFCASSCAAEKSVRKGVSETSMTGAIAGATVDPSSTEEDISKKYSSPIRTEAATEEMTGAPGIDVDLASMSSTVVYAEVYLMVTTPEDYVGKTIHMRGTYKSTYFDETDTHYHYCVIKDATACCQQGLEFIWSGEHAYPADYPAEDAEVEISGVYSSYEELGQTYYCVSTDAIELVGQE